MSAPNNLKCAGCNVFIDGNEYMHCRSCHLKYDILCANVSKCTNDGNWECVLCASKRPKTDNSDTPVRGATGSGGVTHRRGAAMASPVDDHNLTAQNITLEVADLQSLFLELRSLREEVNSKLDVISRHIEGIKDRVSACESRMVKLEERVDSIERRGGGEASAAAAAADSQLMSTIEQLKSELNDRDQELLCNDVELSCVPELKGENVVHSVLVLAKKLGVEVSDRDVVSAVRVGRVLEGGGAAAEEARPRVIVVRVARRALRDQLLQAARVRRGATTEGTGLPGQPRRFYVNERLTRVNRQLFRRARELAGRHGWRFVWSRDGKVFVRRHDGRDAPRHRVRNEQDLVRVFGPDSVGPENGNKK